MRSVALLLPLFVVACSAGRPAPPARVPARNASPPVTPDAPPPATSATVSTADAPAAAGAAEPVTPSSPPVEKTTSRLASGLFNPMPGGVLAGYRADTGLDIAGPPQPVYAIAAGTLDYAEPGHTLWTGPRDSPNCIRIELDEPIPWKGRRITHVWYAHLSALDVHHAEGATSRLRIEAGQRLGTSGVARGSPHLHLGLLLDGEVEQHWGTFLLEDEARQVLGGYRAGARLPKE